MDCSQIVAHPKAIPRQYSMLISCTLLLELSGIIWIFDVRSRARETPGADTRTAFWQ